MAADNETTRVGKQPGQLSGLTAAADLSDYQYHFVKMASETTVNAAGAGEDVVGILQNKPESGDPADVVFFGLSNLVVDGTATRGCFLKSDASAHGTATSTDTDRYGAISLATDHASGDVIPVIVSLGTYAGS